MRLFFLGLALRDYQHDYGPVHAELSKLRARRVSRRIWIVSVPGVDQQALERMSGLIAPGDEMLAVETSGRECLDVMRRVSGPVGRAPVRNAA